MSAADELKTREKQVSLLDEVKKERERIVAELREQQAALKALDVERAKKAEHLSELQRQAGEIAKQLKVLNIERHDEKNHDLIVRFYHAVLDLEEGGTDIGPTLQALLQQVESTVTGDTDGT